ncbi:MAG: hypothetical protein AAB864_02500 [Patescibacteria group bacterium]
MPTNLSQYLIASPFSAGISQEDEASRNAFLQRFNLLTDEQKDILLSPITADLIDRIGRDNGFSDGEIEFMAIVVREVITGLAMSGDIAPLIAEHLQLDQATAANIADRILNEVLNVKLRPRITPESGGIRQLNQSVPSQDQGTDHIINLRDGE